MDLYNLPAELLLTFCSTPYSVVALRLTCARFHKSIPPVREIFTKVEVGNFIIWSSGFWLVRIENYDNRARITTFQHRISAAMTAHDIGDVTSLVDDYASECWSTNWDVNSYIWFDGKSIIFMDHRFGLHLVEDVKNIYYFVNLYTSGDKKVNEVLAAAVGDDDTIVTFKNPVPCRYGAADSFITNHSYAAAFAGCEQDCKVYRRR